MNNWKRCNNVKDTRNQYVGASDIPTLFGLNLHFKEPQSWYTLWKEKTGRSKPEFDEQTQDTMNWGHLHENSTIARYLTGSTAAAIKYLPSVMTDSGEYNGLKWERNTEFIHSKYSFIGCHPDLLLPEEMKIVECKSHGLMATKRNDANSGYDFDDESGSAIPLRYRLQIQYQMMVCGVEVCDFAIISDTNKYHEWRGIKANVKLQSKLLAVARKFWDYVEADKPPRPETMADVFDLYAVPKNTATQVDEEVSYELREMKKVYKNYGAKIKELIEKRKKIQNSIALFVGDAKYLNDFEGEKLATRVDRRGESCKIKELDKRYPNIAGKLRDVGIISAWESREVRL